LVLDQEEEIRNNDLRADAGIKGVQGCPVGSFSTAVEGEKLHN
jgi:hypothetical protein